MFMMSIHASNAELSAAEIRRQKTEERGEREREREQKASPAQHSLADCIELEVHLPGKFGAACNVSNSVSALSAAGRPAGTLNRTCAARILSGEGLTAQGNFMKQTMVDGERRAK